MLMSCEFLKRERKEEVDKTDKIIHGFTPFSNVRPFGGSR
jgi:hypothetical protein